LRLAYSGYAMVEDAAEFQAQAQPLENAKAQLAAAISKYEAGIVTEAGLAAINKIKAAPQDYTNQGAKYVEPVGSDQRAAATDMFQGVMKSYAGVMYDEIEILVSFITDNTNANVEEANSTAQSSLIATIIIAVIAIIISLIGMYLAIARVANPIQR